LAATVKLSSGQLSTLRHASTPGLSGGKYDWFGLSLQETFVDGDGGITDDR
jgi:hypothetical protein